MEYKLSKSSEKDINRLIEYKNRTIYQYAKDLSNEEIDRINKYATSEVPRLINDYCNINIFSLLDIGETAQFYIYRQYYFFVCI